MHRVFSVGVATLESPLGKPQAKITTPPPLGVPRYAVHSPLKAPSAYRRASILAVITKSRPPTGGPPMHPRKDLSADRRASEHSRFFAAEFAFHSTCSLAFAKTRPSHVIRRITTLLHGHNPPAPRRHVPHQNLLMSRSGSHKHLAMHPFIHHYHRHRRHH